MNYNFRGQNSCLKKKRKISSKSGKGHRKAPGSSKGRALVGGMGDEAPLKMWALFNILNHKTELPWQLKMQFIKLYEPVE